ncbi:hypothetical protein Btru_006457 [Bulinus truncatus]|nr:hypothetical protein Btru_006457 [Bulinus truncatus]
MPRKKQALQRPTLTFVPSPDVQPPPILTPEFAVHNPITAKPVQVDDDSFSLSWISPQFHLLDGNKKNRVRRPSCSLKNTTSLLRGKSFNETGVLEDRKSRYRQLQFINCKENLNKNKIPLSSVETNTLKDNTSHPIKKFSKNNETLDVANITVNKLKIHLQDCQENIGNGCKTNSNIDTLDFPENCVKSNNLTLLKHSNVLGNLSDIYSNNIENGLVTDCPDISAQQQHFQIDDINNANITLTPIKAFADSTILAPDTPECDYGLPIRQVQLKYGLIDSV